jgi:hypothetical protein
MYTLSAQQIDNMAQEKSEVCEWGYKEYHKINGEWVLDHLLIPEPDFKRSYKVYPDNRPTEIINWA